LRLLLDTHALLWTLDENPRLSETARAAIGNPANELLISSVSMFEIATKHRLGKLPEFAAIARDFPAILADFEHSALPIGMAHGALAGALDIPHKDPFDRLLIAQARIEQVPIISNEKLFDAFGVERIW
jgi:PIN domain nuclease of toxin-antitoxin system